MALLGLVRDFIRMTTLEELIAAQKKYGIKDHLIWLGPNRFEIAHTDEERNDPDRFKFDGRHLEQCPLHKYLERQEESPMPYGFYIVSANGGNFVFHPWRVDNP